jgi:predicted dehydrogenase
MMTLHVGIIGAGSISRFIHIPGFQLCPDVEVSALCDVSTSTAKQTASAFGVADVYSDYRDVLARLDIDAVVIATPNNLHPEIALAAFDKGKHVLCEKPVALSAERARQMADVARASGLVNMVSFVYRFNPAMRYLRHLVTKGFFGDIRHVRAQYLQQVPEVYLGWRSHRAQAGSGALGDIGSHLIDFARHLAGEITAVSGMTETFLHERAKRDNGDMVACDVDDAAAFLATFASGATGVFEATRLARGRGCAETEYQCVEINGSTSSAVYYLQRPLELQLTVKGPLEDDLALVTVPVPEAFRVFPGASRPAWKYDPVIGFRYDQAFAFVQAIRQGTQVQHDFVDGLRCQAVVDAVLEASEKRQWVPVST